MPLNEQDRKDIRLLKRAKKVAKLLGHGYRAIGVGPGVLFCSNEHPRYPLDMPETLVEHLAAIAEGK